MNTLFPIFLKAEELNIVLAGGGPVGLEKASAILSNSPKCKLKIVAIALLPEIYALKKHYPQLIIIEKEFDKEDLTHVQVLFLAINNKSKSAEIKNLANQKGILVNVADTPDLCDFYLGSVVQKGDLKLAISTNGKSPTVAKRLREMFDAYLPNEMQHILDNMTHIRAKLTGDFAQKVKALNEVTSALISKKD